MQAFRTLMGAIKTEYGYFHSTDVVTSADRDFFSSCIEAMEQDEKLVQIRLGGYPISNYDTNLDVFDIKRSCASESGYEASVYNITMIDTPEFLVSTSLSSTNDIVWTLPMSAKCQKKFYAIPFWNCIMRTSFIQKILEATDPLIKQGEWSMSDYLAHINGAPDMVEYSMGETDAKWPAPYEFIEDLKQGLLNLSCYVYALGRESRPLEEFKKANMIEIRSVDDLIQWRQGK